MKVKKKTWASPSHSTHSPRLMNTLAATCFVLHQKAQSACYITPPRPTDHQDATECHPIPSFTHQSPLPMESGLWCSSWGADPPSRRDWALPPEGHALQWPLHHAHGSFLDAIQPIHPPMIKPSCRQGTPTSHLCFPTNPKHLPA